MKKLRTVKSYTKRQRKLSSSKQKIFDELWPKYRLDIKDCPLKSEELFYRNAYTTLEIGFGNGENLFHIAKTNPEQDFIGIEIHVPGIANILTLSEGHPLTNLKIYNDDAVAVLKNCIPDNFLDKILILFPDPWPKKRHHKRRLIQPKFIDLLHQKLKSNGILNIATDWENYAEHIGEVLANNSIFSKIDSTTTNRNPTKFEKRGTDKGHKVFEYHFLKLKQT